MEKKLRNIKELAEEFKSKFNSTKSKAEELIKKIYFSPRLVNRIIDLTCDSSGEPDKAIVELIISSKKLSNEERLKFAKRYRAFPQIAWSGFRYVPKTSQNIWEFLRILGPGNIIWKKQNGCRHPEYSNGLAVFKFVILNYVVGGYIGMVYKSWGQILKEILKLKNLYPRLPCDIYEDILKLCDSSMKLNQRKLRAMGEAVGLKCFWDIILCEEYLDPRTLSKEDMSRIYKSGISREQRMRITEIRRKKEETPDSHTLHQQDASGGDKSEEQSWVMKVKNFLDKTRKDENNPYRNITVEDIIELIDINKLTAQQVLGIMRERYRQYDEDKYKYNDTIWVLCRAFQLKFRKRVEVLKKLNSEELLMLLDFGYPSWNKPIIQALDRRTAVDPSSLPLNKNISKGSGWRESKDALGRIFTDKGISKETIRFLAKKSKNIDICFGFIKSGRFSKREMMDTVTKESAIKNNPYGYHQLIRSGKFSDQEIIGLVRSFSEEESRSDKASLWDEAIMAMDLQSWSYDDLIDLAIVSPLYDKEARKRIVSILKQKEKKNKEPPSKRRGYFFSVRA